MDKYEYKVRAEEIKALIGQKEYAAAVEIADTVDWRRVKSVMMLCTVSDLYKMSRRYEESKELLLLAYERHPGGRMIVYSLCELAIKMQETVQAIEYYKEFVQIAPKDSGRYILQYKLYEAQEVSLEERIAVLEEMKRHDYREKWAYELAYLYHRIGLSTRCVEECDELILWFGEGKYVTKAMELKMLHRPLSAAQAERYQGKAPLQAEQSMEEEEEEQEDRQEEIPMPIEIKSLDASDAPTVEIPSRDLDIQVKTVKVGQYDTINLQKELAESMKELLQETKAPAPLPIVLEEEEEGPGIVTQAIVAPLLEETEEIPPVEEVKEIFFEDSTEEIEQAAIEAGLPEEIFSEEVITEELEAGPEPEVPAEDMEIGLTAEEKEEERNRSADFSQMLAQEYDGQLSIVVPGGAPLEKQITGQMSIEDILAEWEKMKKENEQKRAEEVRQRVLEHTGSLFSEFDAQTKSGILAQLDEAYENTVKEKPADKTDAGELPELEITEDLGDIEDLEELNEAVIPEEVYEPLDEQMELAEEIAQEAEEEEPAPVEAPVGEESELTDGTAPAQEPVTEVEEEAPEDDSEPENYTARNLTEEERELFGSFIQTKKEKNQIIHAIDTVSLATYTGNVIITGEPGSGTIELAKNLIKEVQMSDANFSGKVAKITGKVLNTKNVDNTLAKMNNGALIIEKAGDLQENTLDAVSKYLDRDKGGIIVIMEDTVKAMNRILENGHRIKENFNCRIDINALNNDALVSYGKRYAQELEYSIDELGVLALYTRIAEMQTSEHVVSAAEIREIVDEAIDHANRKNLKHFMDILLAKRYDEEDMIILREHDFI